MAQDAAQHVEALTRFFRSKLGDKVDDLVARTVADSASGGEAMQGRASFRAHLFRIARQRVVEHLLNKHVGDAAIELGSVSVADLGTPPSMKLARSEAEILVAAALRRVPLDLQITLELAYWESMTAVEIADVLGMPLAAVLPSLAHAKTLFRTELERMNADEALVSQTLARVDSAVL